MSLGELLTRIDEQNDRFLLARKQLVQLARLDCPSVSFGLLEAEDRLAGHAALQRPAARSPGRHTPLSDEDVWKAQLSVPGGGDRRPHRALVAAADDRGAADRDEIIGPLDRLP